MRAALGMVMTDASITNASITNASITNVSITNVSITNVSITNVSITNVSITNVSITNILSLTDQDKRRLRQDVLAEYSAWVDEVSEDCDFKTEFSKEELTYKVTDIVIEKLLCLKK